MSARFDERVVKPAVVGALCAGVWVGFLEASAWLVASGHPGERGVLWWGPTGYAVLFAVVAAAVALVSRLTGTALARARQPERVFATCFAAASCLAVLGVGRWRFYADFRRGIEDTPTEKLVIGAATLLLACLVGVVAWRWALRRRRSLLVATVLLYAAAWGVGMAPVERQLAEPPVSQAEPGHPDVFLIVADALRPDFLEVYAPDSLARTPSLAVFAKDAIVFRESYAQSSWTKPSFATLLSGLHPASHTAVTQLAQLPDEVVTLAERLGEHGYRTRGMSNANVNNSGSMNFSQGFHSWDDLEPSHYLLGAPRSATRLVIYDRLVERVAALLGVPDDVHHYYQPAQDVTGASLAWLDREAPADGTPLFMLVHYMDPHSPYMNGRTRGAGLRPLTSAPQDLPPREAIMDAYAGDIESMDRHLGRFLAGLQQRGRYDDALIVFTADHGEEFDEHGGWEHGDSLYDEQIAVPLLIKLPRSSHGGSTSEHVARQIDIVPTVLAVTGIALDEALPGRVLLDAQHGVLVPDEEPACFSETQARAHLQSLRLPDAKLIRTVAAGQPPTDRLEYYRLGNDGSELHDLASEGDPRVAGLQRLLDEVLARTQAAAVDAAALPALSSDMELQLRALGYLK